MMKKRNMVVTGLLAGLMAASGANAFLYNGSEYSIVAGTPHTWNPHNGANYTWTEAKSDAEARGGHLATFGDAAEWNAVVAGLGLDGSSQYWLGGSQSFSASSPTDSWSWVDGTAWSFTAWAPGEPNDHPTYFWQPAENGSENYLMTWGDGSVWNDSSNGSSHFLNQGYILETVAAVSEPGSLALLGLGLAGLGFARRRADK